MKQICLISLKLRGTRNFYTKCIFASIILFLTTNPVFAVATPSGTSSPSGQTTPTTKAQDLLNRVATKVAELSDQMKRTYHGPIKSAASNTYTITTADGERKVLTNNATSFYRIRASSRTEVDFKDLKAADYVSAAGTIDANTLEMTAKQVISKIHRYIYIGKLDSLEKNIAIITLADNSQVKVDLTATPLRKIQEGKINPAKLADFTTGSTIFVIAHSPNLKTGIYSSLKALTVQK